jgi:O-antigen/teichoic acid export membrane protein
VSEAERPVSGAERPDSLVRAAAATYATNVAVVALSLVNVLIVARALGPTGRGEVAFLIAVSLVTAHLSSLGVQEANANLAGSEPRLRARLATNSVLLALGLGGLGAAVVAALVAAVPAVGGDVEPALLWLSLAANPIFLARTYLSFLVQADYGFSATNRAWIAGPAVSAVANATLAALGVITVTLAMIAWVAGQVLAAGILISYVRRTAGFGRPDRRLAARSLRFGVKTHMGHTMAVGNYRADQWFLGAVAGSRELGLYSIAVSCAEVLFYLPGILVLVQRPDLVRARAREAAERAARALRSALLLSVPAVVFVLITAPLVCTTVFGADFEDAGDDLRVLALATFGVSALELLRNALTAQRRPLLASSAVAVAFGMTVALNLILAPSYGGLGAAIAATAAQTAGGLAAALLFSRALGGRLTDLVPRPRDAAWLSGKMRQGLVRAHDTSAEGPR